MSFDDWMKRVDAHIAKRFGLTSADLPDCCYRDWYCDGMGPVSAAKKAIRAADGDDE